MVINVTAIMIGNVFIQTKFSVWGGEGTKLNKYDQLLSFKR